MKAAILKAAVATLAMVICSAAAADEAEVRRATERLYPAAKIREINPTKVSGIYEVVVDSEIVYADAQGKHFFMGAQMIGVERRLNATDAVGPFLREGRSQNWVPLSACWRN